MSATRRWTDTMSPTTRAPGSRRLRPPRCPGPSRAQGAGNLTLTWAVRDGDWTIVVMNTDARPGLSVRAKTGISALALSWLAGELLGVGLLTGVTAAALILVPVRLTSRPGTRRDPAMTVQADVAVTGLTGVTAGRAGQDRRRAGHTVPSAPGPAWPDPAGQRADADQRDPRRPPARRGPRLPSCLKPRRAGRRRQRPEASCRPGHWPLPQGGAATERADGACAARSASRRGPVT